MKFDNDFKEMKIRHIVFMFLIVLLFSIVCAIAIALKKGDISNTDKNILSLVIEILLVFMMAFKLKLSKENVKRLYLDFKENLNMKEIIWIILFTACLQIGSNNILVDLAYLISPDFANWFSNDSAMVINTVTDYIIVFIMVVFLAPFTEEIIFRNTIFKRLAKKFNVYIGLIVSSIIFCSLNFGAQMIGIFLLGIVNCVLYVKYENILIPMFIYFLNGIIGMIFILLFHGFGVQNIILTSKDMIFYAFSGVVLFSAGMVFFVKFIRENKSYLREMYNKKKQLELTGVGLSK
ncbi:CPBP family intramembrane glutamic endopeptidase [Clostridium sp. C2-6-12]|uniref:CPBP family intramembrane glutamic endopeptidase n=1 Tax=Clostridium sp. C2-6-12 TaxID=2698832 RepID=UPI00136E0485|nr:CPBP family intramembrane glutamic endopeptidase [Clostridium sp. C2-6-12]